MALTLILLICLFVIERTFIGFARGFIGDVVIVMFIYSFLKIIKNFNSLKLGICVLGFSFLIEIAQLLDVITKLGIQENQLTNLLFGSVFDPLDLLAYTIGVIFIFAIDKQIHNKA